MSESATAPAPAPDQPQAQPQAPNVKVAGPPFGYTTAGHAFWMLPNSPWALFRPDGKYFFPVVDPKQAYNE